MGDKELLALVEGVKKFWGYLKGRRFVAYTDHKPLLNIMSRKGLEMTGREVRAWEKLAKADFELKYVPSKENVVADAFSRGVAMVGMVKIKDKEVQEQWGKRQKKCEEVQRLIEIMKGKVKKSKWQTEKENLKIDEDVLWHMYKDKLKGVVWQIVVPTEWRKSILKQGHDEMGHYSYRVVKEWIRKKWWWPSMSKDIKKWIDECGVCRKSKGNEKRVPMKSHMVERVNQRVALDICGPFPEVRGYKYVAVGVECFSKFVVAFPLKGLTAEEVYEGFVNNYVYVFGAPEELLTDRGANLIGGLAKKVCEEFGIKKIQTTAEHPQADPAERYIRTFKEVLN